jgi:hypothetical protein
MSSIEIANGSVIFQTDLIICFHILPQTDSGSMINRNAA